MQELIKIKINENQQQVVSAKELYLKLGFDKSNWASWSRKNIVENEFALENEDWVGFVVSTNGNETKDYAISIPFAKRIAMMARTNVGEEIRRYFIECEKQLKQIQVPKSYAEALLEAGRIALELEQAQIKLNEAKPKIDFYDAVIQSNDCVDIGTAAKVLNLGFGRTTLFERLRKSNVLMANNTPYQKYCDMGWFRVVETKWQDKRGETHISFKTVVFQKGLEGIKKLIAG
jgi:anti-repressor protein